MKMNVIAAALLMGSSSYAVAAGGIAYEPLPVPDGAATAYDWSGVFIGVHAGYGWRDGGTTYPDYVYTSETRPDGFLAGMYAGYSHQFTNGLVLGVDGDITWSNANDWDSLEMPGPPPINVPGLIDRQKLKWSAALRGRVGYTFNRYLPYIAGGVSVAKVQQNMFDDYTGTDVNLGSSSFTGWTVGAGVDYAWSDNLLIRAEYRYTDFGNKFIDHPALDAPTWHLKSNDIRLGIAYKF